MRVILVGSGNVATHVALALHAAGIVVAQVWSKHFHNAENLAHKVQAKAIADFSELDKDADFCIISIKDDAIAETVKELASFKGILLHTAGAVSLDIFGSNSKNVGVLYPLQTFSVAKNVNFHSIPICIEATNEETLKSIRELAVKLSENVVEVSSEKRKILHLAAVFACNFTNHLYTLSSDLLRANDLSFDMIRPLILETAEKVQLALPNQVQTGPAIRNDEQTLKNHEELLLKQPQLLNIYRTLSESIKKTKK